MGIWAEQGLRKGQLWADFPEECMNALVTLGLSRETWAGNPRVEFLNVGMERSFFPIPDPRRLDHQIIEHLSVLHEMSGSWKLQDHFRIGLVTRESGHAIQRNFQPQPPAKREELRWG